MHGLVASLLFSTCGADSAVVDWTIFQKEITVGGDQCVYSTNGEVSYEGTLEYKDGEKNAVCWSNTRTSDGTLSASSSRGVTLLPSVC